MREPIWMEVADAVTAHDAELAAHGGSEGIRDPGLLESALARAKNIWNYADSPTPLTRLAAAYGFGISANHSFVDGNKRTSLVVSFAFCEVNGLEMTAGQEDAYLTFLALAAGEITEDQLVDWFARNTAS